tara:strand:- start:115 stop:426 length:312 start_codon:yes stop_codon:yes gene_type:complete
VIDMSWESILKEDFMSEISTIIDNELVGEEGEDLDDIMRIINEKFGVKTKILYDSSSQPVLGFNLPIFAQCYLGKSFGNIKERHLEKEKFTIIDVGINDSEIR